MIRADTRDPRRFFISTYRADQHGIFIASKKSGQSLPKAEADEKFGNKELMTVEEYFGKLWYIVEGLYKGIPSKLITK